MNKQVFDALLTAMIQSTDGISDLLFTVGRLPLVEIHGRLQEFPLDPPGSVLDPTHIAAMTAHVINGDQRLMTDLENSGSCDCSYALANIARFRINVFRQGGKQAIVMRKLQSEIPTLDNLGLPPVFREMVKEKNGIIFVTGATGSGKTTTLAAMLNELNLTQQIHIISLELTTTACLTS